MINSSSALPQSSGFICEFCDSTTYVYCKFENYPTNNIREDMYVENDVETSQSSDTEDDRQVLSLTSEFIPNPLVLLTQEINRSEAAGVNGKKGFSASSNKNQPEMYPAANDVLKNNFAGCSKQLGVPKTTVKRKLFDTVKPEIPPKKMTLRSRIGQDDTYKFLPGLSDSIADNFLQQFDREIDDDSTECLPKMKREDLCKQCNLRSHKSLPKRSADQLQRKAVPLLKEESFGNGNRDINFNINQSGFFSTSEESSNTDETESTEKNDHKEIPKKINVLVRSNSRSSVSSDTDSISSMASTVSRYGRIRKPSSFYVNATMFNGGVKKSAEIKEKASTLVNSHKCQNDPSGSLGATSKLCPDQFDILTRTHKRMVSPQLEKTASTITPSKNRQTTRKFCSWRNSSFNEQLPEPSHNEKILVLEKAAKQTAPSADESDFINEKLGFQNGASGSSASIGDYSQQLNLIQTSVCSRCKQTAALIRDRPPENDIFKRPLATNEFRNTQSLKNNKEASPVSQKIAIDNCGSNFDPSEIHAVVNDEVVPLKWYSPAPDLELVFGNGANVFYSMRNMKSHYTNVTVGYLKIDAGHKKPLAILKNYILLYFVERGEGIFKVSGRKMPGQIGCTVFVPLGAEYSITNSSTEVDFILKFVIISPQSSPFSEVN